jgi:hypothetical protein
MSATTASRSREARWALPRGSRIMPAPGAVACAQGDGLVLLDVRGGRRIALDGFGRRVWQGLADGPSLAGLLARVRDDDAPVERLAEDVARLLARWSAGDLIIWR